MVTGAAGGIGSAVVDALAGAGARVAAVDSDEVTLRHRYGHMAETASVRRLRMTRVPVPAVAMAMAVGGSADTVDAAAECGDSGARGMAPQVVGYVADVADTSMAEAVLDHVEAEFGPVGLLVNAAGMLRTGPVDACTDADWAGLLSVNATGVFVWARAVAGRMTAHRRGAIITVSSNCVGVPRAGLAAYAASKAAAGAFTLGLGLEVAPLGIRCNIVCPGSTDTPMLRSLTDAGAGLDAVLGGSLANFRNGIPLGRIATPGDIADAILFLASDQARHITLHSLYVDGGAALNG